MKKYILIAILCLLVLIFSWAYSFWNNSCRDFEEKKGSVSLGSGYYLVDIQDDGFGVEKWDLSLFPFRFEVEFYLSKTQFIIVQPNGGMWQPIRYRGNSEISFSGGGIRLLQEVWRTGSGYLGLSPLEVGVAIGEDYLAFPSGLNLFVEKCFFTGELGYKMESDTN